MLVVVFNDLLVGLVVWIVEKFCMWSDCDGDVGWWFLYDMLLMGILFYWFIGCIGLLM